MPNYDYHCNACGQSFDQQQKIEARKEPETKPCPLCGAREVKFGIQKASPVGDRLFGKPPTEFMKNVIGRINSSVPGSNIGETSRYQIPKEV